MGFFSEMLSLSPDDADLRRIRTNSLTEAIQLWGSPDENKIEPAIKAGEEWLAEQRPNERRQPDWNRLKLALARAYVAQANSANDDGKSMTRARRLANEVSRFRGPLQREAQELLVSWGKKQEQAKQRPQPKTFAEAVEAAYEVRSEHKMATTTVAQLTPRLQGDVDAKQRNEMETMIREAQQRIPTLARLEIELLQLAVDLADETIPADQISELRSQQCYYYYLMKEDLRASVVGEFLGRRYPNATGSRHAMRIALVSLSRFRDSLPMEDAQISRRIIDVAEYITSTWPDSQEAAVAFSELTKSAIRNRDFDAAEAYLAKISADSPSLGDYEMATGQAIWLEYLARRKAAAAGDASSDDIQALRKRGLKLLNQGIDRKRSGVLTEATVRAIMALAQSYVDSQTFDQAIALMDDKKTGPHALTLARHPLMTNGGLGEQAIYIAIQAYVGSIDDADSATARMEQALASLDFLQELYGQAEGQGGRRVDCGIRQFGAETESADPAGSHRFPVRYRTRLRADSESNRRCRTADRDAHLDDAVAGRPGCVIDPSAGADPSGRRPHPEQCGQIARGPAAIARLGRAAKNHCQVPHRPDPASAGELPNLHRAVGDPDQIE